MRKKIILPAFFVFSASMVFAHEHWVLVDYPSSDGGNAARVQICSGHSFPKSEILLAERLLADMEASGPDGKTKFFKPTAMDKSWMANISLDNPGVWVVSFALKKPQATEPLYLGRTLVVVGAKDDPSRYACRKGLELVPAMPLSALKTGDILPLSVTMDGAPMEGTIAVTPDKGSACFLSTSKERQAELKIKGPGNYLLTVSSGGKTFSLTFKVTK
ncbi:MAG: hypothetical protein A2283_19370 [Lentisphaerae bacterium RIFOXYA12_FULL_48_11]|nr:MAG: hypothetical protein A2283_19370 [Lentisphaerae bacterium RIFOXYA12_FULL_48_11]